VAAAQYIASVAEVVDKALERMIDSASSGTELRAAARRLDVAYQALVATVWPMRTPLFGRLANQIAGFMQTATALRHYTRNLVVDVSRSKIDVDDRSDLVQARHQLAASLAEITSVLDTGAAHGPYVRSASLLSLVATSVPASHSSPAQLALRDLQLIDGSCAEAAHWAGLIVTDLDTEAASQR
jgi:hypothetical protein